MELNEQEQWKAFSSGNEQVFEKVFRNYYQGLCNYANTFLEDMDEAEEVVQQVFFAIWNKRTTIEIASTLKAYLYRSVHNHCLNKLKQGKVKQLYAENYKAVTEKTNDNVSQRVLAKELEQKIFEAINELPEQCGNVFKLSRFEKLKYQQIAAQLNISVKTVENHMGKALKLLRIQLREYLPTLFWFCYLMIKNNLF